MLHHVKLKDKSFIVYWNKLWINQLCLNSKLPDVGSIIFYIHSTLLMSNSFRIMISDNVKKVISYFEHPSYVVPFLFLIMVDNYQVKNWSYLINIQTFSWMTKARWICNNCQINCINSLHLFEVLICNLWLSDCPLLLTMWP